MSVLKYGNQMDIHSLGEHFVIAQAVTRSMMAKMNNSPEFRAKLAEAERMTGKKFRLGQMYVKQCVDDAIGRADAKMQAKQEEITRKKENERMVKDVSQIAN